jgi:hypothetical protein
MTREGIADLPSFRGPVHIRSSFRAQIGLGVGDQLFHITASCVLTTSDGKIAAAWSPGDPQDEAQELMSHLVGELSRCWVTADGTATLQFSDGRRLVVLPTAASVEAWLAVGKDWSVRCEPSDPDVFTDVTGDIELPGGCRRLSAAMSVGEFRERLVQRGELRTSEED